MRRIRLTGRSDQTAADVLARVLDIARADDFEGYSKHDALNAPWLERLAGGPGSAGWSPSSSSCAARSTCAPWSGYARRATPRACPCSPGRCWPGTG